MERFPGGVKETQRGPVDLIDDALIAATLQRARSSARLRTNHNFHLDMEDNPHRFLNVMLRNTYITPHRHLNPPKAETFLLLSGEIAFFLFDDDGGVQAMHRLAAAKDGVPRGIDIQPGLWHTLVVLSEEAVCFEVKPGPYRASDDKEFAPWAPAEGSPACQQYLEGLLAKL